MNKFNILKFQFGRQKKSLKELIVSNAILHTTLNALSTLTNKTKRVLFNQIDNPELTEVIVQDDELLTYRVEKDVDEALKNV